SYSRSYVDCSPSHAITPLPARWHGSCLPAVSAVSDQDLAEECLGPLVLRTVEHVVRCTAFDDLAVVHEQDLISHFPGEPHLVADHHHRHSAQREVLH